LQPRTTILPLVLTTVGGGGGDPIGVPMPTPRWVLTMLALAVSLAGGCGSQTPSESSRTCRRYATLMGYGSGQPGTRDCTWNVVDANAYVCGIWCAHTTRQYASLADFVEEASVPNRPLVTSEGIGYSCGMGNTAGYSTGYYRYDAQRRLVEIQWQGQWGYSDEPSSATVDTYTAWDSRGRPLSGTRSGPGGGMEISIVYDDGTRTMTTSIGPNEAIRQEDEFGNMVRDGDYTYTVLETAEVCL